MAGGPLMLNFLTGSSCGTPGAWLRGGLVMMQYNRRRNAPALPGRTAHTRPPGERRFRDPLKKSLPP